MRLFLTGPFLLALGFGWTPIPQLETPLRELLSDDEYRTYRQKPQYRSRMDFFRNVLARRVATLDQHLDQNQVKATAALLGNIQDLSHYLLDEMSRAKSEKDRRSKQVKKLEISLRKLGERLQDLQTTVPFEYTERFQETVDDLERLRKALLRQLLGQGNSHGPNQQKGTTQAAVETQSFLSGALGTMPPQVLLRSRDRFTENEFTAIQINQDLVKRVEVFLEIARSRLEEIARRREQRVWNEKETNPLEFFTYQDMVHAYTRAIDSALINIDEKAIHELASEEDLKRSLKAIYEGMKEFRPQLGAIETMAIDQKDEALYRKVVEAQEASDIAYQGALLGLGISSQ